MSDLEEVRRGDRNREMTEGEEIFREMLKAEQARQEIVLKSQMTLTYHEIQNIKEWLEQKEWELEMMKKNGTNLVKMSNLTAKKTGCQSDQGFKVVFPKRN